MPAIRRHTRRHVPRAILLAFVLLAALAVSGHAAASTCGKQVIADWYDNGRVDQIYGLQCYRDAVSALPVDVRDYSSAKDDIMRALAVAQRDQAGQTTKPTQDTSSEDDEPAAVGTGSGGSSGSTDDTSGGSGSGQEETPSEAPASTEPATSGAKTPPTVPSKPIAREAIVEAADEVDTSGPSSVPIPLIVLAGLAALLLAAGAVGYLSRRSQSRGDGDPGAAA